MHDGERVSHTRFKYTFATRSMALRTDIEKLERLIITQQMLYETYGKFVDGLGRTPNSYFSILVLISCGKTPWPRRRLVFVAKVVAKVRAENLFVWA
jgi:hypothetical protein